jgi:outer membrane protein assembly factor BamD (BamD/ComL family)
MTIAFLSITSIQGISQNELKKNWFKGNNAYENEAYDDALIYYQKAIDDSPLNFKVNFNLGNTNVRLKDFEQAIEIYNQIVELAPTNLDQAWVYHNLGNAYFFNQKLEDAIEAYKSALRLNPTDEETRYNLAYAQFLKKEQDKKNPPDQQDQKDQNDQNDQKDPKDKNDQNDQKDKNDPKDPKDQNDQKDEKDKKDQKEKNGEGSPKHQPISKEQAKRILDAAARNEKKVQGELDKDKVIGTGTSGKIDW